MPAAASPRAIAARHPQAADRHLQIAHRAAKAASAVRNEAARVDLRVATLAAASVAPKVPREPIVRRARTSSVVHVPALRMHRRAESVPPVQAARLARAPSIARIASADLIARNVAARHEAASRKAARRVPQAAASAVTSRLATGHLALPGALAATVPERPQDRLDSHKTAPAVLHAMRGVRPAASAAAKDEVPPGRTALSASPRGIVQIVPPADRAALKAVRLPEQVVRVPEQAVRVPEQVVVQVRQQAVRAVSAAPRAAMVSRGRPSAVVNHALRETAPSSGRMLRQRDRPPKRGPGGPYAKPASGDRSERKFTPRPRPEAGTGEGGERESRPFRASGQRPSRPGGFGKSAGRPGSFGKPSYGKSSGYRKPSEDRPPTGGERPAASGDRPERPRPPRPAFGSGAGKPGGFRKPGAPDLRQASSGELGQTSPRRSRQGSHPPHKQRHARARRRRKARTEPGGSSPARKRRLQIRRLQARWSKRPVGNHPPASARQSASRVVRGTKARCPLHDRRSS